MWTEDEESDCGGHRYRPDAYTERVAPRRLRSTDVDDLGLTLELIRREFAYMDGMVDPPSSVRLLTVDDLASGPGETWVIGTPPIACVVMTPKSNVLYVGKLAVSETERGRGLARQLLYQADVRAAELGLPQIELQVRVELTANHRAFAALGFVEIARTPHPGYDRPTSITFRRAVMTPD